MGGRERRFADKDQAARERAGIQDKKGRPVRKPKSQLKPEPKPK